jgi:hypothetical protein
MTSQLLSLQSEHECVVNELQQITADSNSHTSLSNMSESSNPTPREFTHQFVVSRSVNAVFAGEGRPLGIGLGNLSRGSHLTVVKTTSMGTLKAPTGVALHNQMAMERARNSQTTDAASDQIEVGMCLVSINGISSFPMSYSEIITAIKQLPRPVNLEFGVLTWLHVCLNQKKSR